MLKCHRSSRLLILLAAAVSVMPFAATPARASSCNLTKALNLLTRGQTESVNGNKATAVDTQLQAAREGWICYEDRNQSSEVRGKMGKASADILNGAAQDADAAGDQDKALRIAKLALAEYKQLARDRTLPLAIRVYADSVVQAATSP
jgi:hypothetical protein